MSFLILHLVNEMKNSQQLYSSEFLKLCIRYVCVCMRACAHTHISALKAFFQSAAQFEGLPLRRNKLRTPPGMPKHSDMSTVIL